MMADNGGMSNSPDYQIYRHPEYCPAHRRYTLYLRKGSRLEVVKRFATRAEAKAHLAALINTEQI